MRQMPVAPPIQGMTGASPMRAAQGMMGGLNRTSAPLFAQPQTQPGQRPQFEITYQNDARGTPLVQAMQPGQNVGAATGYGPQMYNNPLTSRLPNQPVPPPPPQFGITPQNDARNSPIVQAMQPSTNIGAATGYGPQTANNPLTSRLPAAQTATPEDRIRRAADTLQRASSSNPLTMTPGANASAATGYGQQTAAPAAAPPATGFAAGGGGGRLSTTTPNVYNAADPTRALQLMRGY